MKKLMISISLVAFLMSCSYTSKDYRELRKKVVPIEKPVEKPNLGDKSNEDILNSEDLTKQVFDRKTRKINNNLKGVWVSTVYNLDFPKNKGYQPEMQKKEIDTIVENIKSWGFNAIFLQVKPTNDALYNSRNLPWSTYLTGTEDAHPGYDPLQYFITKAHENGIELHAWINPYRVSMTKDTSKLSARNVAIQHPDWVFEYDGKLYLNPGKPEVVKYLYENIEEIVKNYDIDGIHLDDYFYPYPSNNKKLPNFDVEEYEKYKRKFAFSTVGDFRRSNVNDLIKNLSTSVHKLKPQILFGVSPFGIWRNSNNDLTGSNTNGLQSYDDLFADSVKWMNEGWVDYIAPQIYWNVNHQKADYRELVKWWSDVAEKTNTPLYVGEGIYKANEWANGELALHKDIRNNNAGVKGYILFRYEILLKNPWIINEVD